MTLRSLLFDAFCIAPASWLGFLRERGEISQVTLQGVALDYFYSLNFIREGCYANAMLCYTFPISAQMQGEKI